MATKQKAKVKSRRSGQGSVFQRKDGRWGWAITCGYDVNGNPVRHQGIKPIREEAVEALNEVMARLRMGMPATDSSRTLASFMGSWLSDVVEGKNAPRTMRFYEQMTRLYIVPALGHIPLGKLSAQQVQRFLNELSRKGRTADRKNKEGKTVTVQLPPLSASTIGHVRATLRASLQTAWKWSFIRENPAKKVSLPMATTKREAVYLTPEEANALVEAGKGHYLGNLVKFALNTGLRLGEATGLTWEDIDLDKGSIVVRHQLQYNDGAFALRDPKSGTSRRTLPLTQAAIESLREQRANQLLWSSMVGEDFNPMGLAFTGQLGRPLFPKTVDKNLKEFAAQAGISKTIGFHKLRHTAGTWLVAKGVPLNVVKEILGHSQIAITANLYAHAVPAIHRAAFDMLEEAYRAVD